MNPFVRYLVIGAVGFIVAAALGIVGLLSADTPMVQGLAMVAGSLLAAAICIFLFIQAWRWSIIAYRERRTGRSLLVALTGGVIILMAAGALSVAAILGLLFFG